MTERQYLRGIALVLGLGLAICSVGAFWTEYDTVVRWQAEGLAAWNAWQVFEWQDWWEADPWELAYLCWSTFTNWASTLASLVSLGGAVWGPRKKVRKT